MLGESERPRVSRVSAREKIKLHPDESKYARHVTTERRRGTAKWVGSIRSMWDLEKSKLPSVTALSSSILPTVGSSVSYHPVQYCTVLYCAVHSTPWGARTPFHVVIRCSERRVHRRGGPTGQTSNTTGFIVYYSVKLDPGLQAGGPWPGTDSTLTLERVGCIGQSKRVGKHQLPEVEVGLIAS
jgi:hypothetical protein